MLKPDGQLINVVLNIKSKLKLQRTEENEAAKKDRWPNVSHFSEGNYLLLKKNTVNDKMKKI